MYLLTEKKTISDLVLPDPFPFCRLLTPEEDAQWNLPNDLVDNFLLLLYLDTFRQWKDDAHCSSLVDL